MNSKNKTHNYKTWIISECIKNGLPKYRNKKLITYKAWHPNCSKITTKSFGWDFPTTNIREQHSTYLKNTENWHSVKRTTINLVVTMLLWKPTSEFLPLIIGQNFILMSSTTQKHVYDVNREKGQLTNLLHFNRCQFRTNPTCGSMQTFSARCSRLDDSTNTSSASRTLHQIRDGHGRGKQGGRDRGEGHFFRMVL